MKKLLLVLLVVTLASFLLVGCLPGTTPAEGEGEGEGEGEVEVAMTFNPEYTNTGGVTYISCDSTVTVTFPSPVAVDYVVSVNVKIYDEEDEVYDYVHIRFAEPNSDRTIWTIDDYGWIETDCEPVCIVAVIQHPCCPGEEVALRVITVDCMPPELDLFVKFTDCADECVEPDPCNPPVPGAYMEWTSRTSDACETTDCCEDTCSLVNGWSLVIDPDECEGPCDTESGQGCPVEGAIECGCLAYAPDTSENVCYYVDFNFEDNVGNALTSTWKLCFDTDELVSFEVEYYPGDGFKPDVTRYPDEDGWYQIYDDCTPIQNPG